MSPRRRVLSLAHIVLLIFVCCRSTGRANAQSQPDGRSWELSAADLQSVGLHLPSYMPTLRDLQAYQALLPTHQEVLLDWDPHTGYDHPVLREQVAEHSLKHDFTLLERKQNVKGNAPIGLVMLMDLGLEVVGATSTGEVRGLTSGPSLLVQGESLAVPGQSAPEHHDYVMGKDQFRVSLPDDPKIEKIVLLVIHPNEKPRLEQAAVIILVPTTPPK